MDAALRTNTPPQVWSVDQVVACVIDSGFGADVVQALRENEVDGSTFVTLTREELRDDLKIRALPMRRKLLDLIQQLTVGISHQPPQDNTKSTSLTRETSTRSHDITVRTDLPDMAQQLHALEMSGQDQYMDPELLATMRAEARIESQLKKDRAICEEMSTLRPSQTYYGPYSATLEPLYRTTKPGKFAMTEINATTTFEVVGHVKRPAWQNTNKRLAPHGDRESKPSNSFQKSHSYSRSSHTSVANEATTTVVPRVLDKEEQARKDAREDEIAKTLMALTPVQCSVCKSHDKKGFDLPCDHQMCIPCMRGFLHKGLRETLEPPHCCDIPIDVSIPPLLLKEHEVDIIRLRQMELEAKRKMHCPTCHRFINLDPLSGSDSFVFVCDCGEHLCTFCQTRSHSPRTCKQVLGDSLSEFPPVSSWSGEVNNNNHCPNCTQPIAHTIGYECVVCKECGFEFCGQCHSLWESHPGQCSLPSCRMAQEHKLKQDSPPKEQEKTMSIWKLFSARKSREYVEHNKAHAVVQTCLHDWQQIKHKGQCDMCQIRLNKYGMQCQNICHSTVCFRCASLPKLAVVECNEDTMMQVD
jgi:hypothetical protein